MNIMNKKTTTYLSTLATTATELLAVAGLISLVYSFLNFFEEPINRQMEKLLSADAVVRPVCEDYIERDVGLRDGTRAGLKLIGVQIEAYKDLTNVKIRFQDIAYLEKVMISSNGISESDALAFMKSLPRGTTSINNPLFASLPRLISNSKATVHLTGIPSPRFDCANPWFEVSAPDRTIYHLEFADVLQVRGKKWGVGGSNFYKFLFIATLVALFVVLIYVRVRYVSVKKSPAKRKKSGRASSI